MPEDTLEGKQLTKNAHIIPKTLFTKKLFKKKVCVYRSLTRLSSEYCCLAPALESLLGWGIDNLWWQWVPAVWCKTSLMRNETLPFLLHYNLYCGNPSSLGNILQLVVLTHKQENWIKPWDGIEKPALLSRKKNVVEETISTVILAKDIAISVVEVGVWNKCLSLTCSTEVKVETPSSSNRSLLKLSWRHRNRTGAASLSAIVDRTLKTTASQSNTTKAKQLQETFPLETRPGATTLIDQWE